VTRLPIPMISRSMTNQQNTCAVGSRGEGLHASPSPRAAISTPAILPEVRNLREAFPSPSGRMKHD